MVDRIVIEDPQLAQRIQRIAERERRSVEDVLTTMLAQYQPPGAGRVAPEADELARQVRLAAYQTARDYWRRAGDKERAALTDEQLDREFWLFDADGIPRLKTDKDKVVLSESSLHRAGQVLQSAGFHSGQTDIGARSREILNEEFTDYLVARKNGPGDDASASSD
jgi:hypothetical protein